MSVADIARSLHVEQKPLYRQLERCLRNVRARLAQAGIDGEYLEDMLDRMPDDFASPLRITDPCPSLDSRDADDDKEASQ
jgi:hypothetical protein